MTKSATQPTPALGQVWRAAPIGTTVTAKVCSPSGKTLREEQRIYAGENYGQPVLLPLATQTHRGLTAEWGKVLFHTCQSAPDHDPRPGVGLAGPIVRRDEELHDEEVRCRVVHRGAGRIPDAGQDRSALGGTGVGLSKTGPVARRIPLGEVPYRAEIRPRITSDFMVLRVS